MQEESERAEKLAELRESGEQVYECPNCNELWLRSDLIQIRQCSNENCECIFDGTANGRNCEECNRPFTRKLHEAGCPDCVGEEECDEVEE